MKNINDSHATFLRDVKRIAATSFRPTEDDVLKARLRTTQVILERYNIEGTDFEVCEIDCLDDLIGKKFLFRTVTYHMIGKVEKRIGDFLELSTASWLAESARFMNTIKDGMYNELEPVGKAYLNIKSVVDFFPWNHELPTKQK